MKNTIVPLLAVALTMLWLGYNVGKMHERDVEREEAAARDAKLQADLQAPVDGACPTYEQMIQRRSCQRCLQECYPLVQDGGARP